MAESEGQDNHLDLKAKWDRLLLRASADEQFRNTLLDSPREVLTSGGIEIPRDTSIIVHEFDPQEFHLFLPPLGSPVAKPPVMRLSADAVMRLSANNGAPEGGKAPVKRLSAKNREPKGGKNG